MAPPPPVAPAAEAEPAPTADDADGKAAPARPPPVLAPPGQQPAAPTIGKGFHLFDKQYVLLGFNLQKPCQSTSLELETSYVPIVTNGMWWFGAYATAGFQTAHAAISRPPPSEESPCFKDETKSSGKPQTADPFLYDPNLSHKLRFGAGLEAGWRMIGFDAGVLHNNALRERSNVVAGAPAQDPVVPMGYRFRLGLALSDEVFTGQNATYNRGCCKPTSSAVACECERTPVGVSLFLFYGNELYFKHGRFWDDGMLGLSVKIGVGL